MAGPDDLSDAKLILLAANLCATGDIASLHALAAREPDVLSTDLLLRLLLTFLPASTEPSHYIPFLRYLFVDENGPPPDISLDISSVESLKDTEVQAQLKNISLLPLEGPAQDDVESTDLLTAFLIQRAYQIDDESRDLPLTLRLLEPFIDQSSTVRHWLVSILLPVIRAEYEYYPEKSLGISLSAFDGLDERAAVNTLLQHSRDQTNVGRDLRCLVGPWMYGRNGSKRRKLTHDGRRASISTSTDNNQAKDSAWYEVNDWIVTRSREDFNLAAKAFLDWAGPSDVDLGGYADASAERQNSGAGAEPFYVQTGLAVIYGTDSSSQEIFSNADRILDRAKQLLAVQVSVINGTAPATFPHISQTSRASLFHNSLLQTSNVLTRPTDESIAFTDGILNSVKILNRLGTTVSCRAATELCLLAGEDTQKQELRNILQRLARSSGNKVNWTSTRNEIIWLHTWGQPGETSSKDFRSLLWRVNFQILDAEILDALLTAGQYPLVVETYLQSPDSTYLDAGQIDKTVEQAILRNYDNSSNGNRTRGGMKRAAEILKAFRPHLPDSSSIHRIEYLLAATHSISFYHLTLQHGVPFQPVNIRIHPDPIALIGKVLEQNQKAYTKVDDLVSIGRNFVKAGLPVDENEHELSTEQALAEAERRVTYLAMESALFSSDFDTAYSYILTRLTPPSSKHETNTYNDDYSWRAAYLAGRNRPKQSSDQNTPLTVQISSLSKRMELLSLALTLAPSPEPLPEILGTWRRCEEELNSLKSAEAEEEEEWDSRGDSIVPGGFGPEDREMDIEETQRQRARRLAEQRSTKRTAYEEEAPVGLFEVARGAASAIRKSAFPLRGGAAGGRPAGIGRHIPASSNSMHDSEARADGSDMESSFTSTGSGGGVDDQGQRVRKRDMVSNMVTGGLVSGMSWVLGAQPVHQRTESEDD